VTRTLALTPTVRLLELEVGAQQLPQRFVPGQWVDLFIPGEPTVGGYSICRYGLVNAALWIALAS
jgi:ferredoxin-NADP reductase